jgi:dihydroneopterin aldolase/2-amino-4-hydroxy-6-hydroxymethyldihydropteridine diphosphokinase/dihydropteroate synthase
MFADSAEIQVTRTVADYEVPAALALTSVTHRAVLALGSNLGDRVGNIEKALKILESRGILIMDTSFMYESAAMYVESQPKFANTVCTVHLVHWHWIEIIDQETHRSKQCFCPWSY